jgi:hypothetical protein
MLQYIYSALLICAIFFNGRVPLSYEGTGKSDWGSSTAGWLARWFLIAWRMWHVYFGANDSEGDVNGYLPAITHAFDALGRAVIITTMHMESRNRDAHNSECSVDQKYIRTSRCILCSPNHSTWNAKRRLKQRVVTGTCSSGMTIAVKG